MIDYARITVLAGKGGNGAGSFLSIKGRRRGKADGGDGGRGGNVYMVTTRDLNTLEPFRYKKVYKAKVGDNGLSRMRKGAEGEDLIINVPVGTLIKVKSNKELRKSFDLVREGEKVLICEGGEGGKGNSHLRDEYGRRPLSGGKGQDGDVLKLELELKLIADVGLIGLPNAGKSTLISTLTAARPKVADYPFTTLEPNLGVLDGVSFVVNRSSGKKNSPHDRSTMNNKRIVIADIPGLIEGASRGKGLGDIFLRHIERTKILVHLIDISQENDYWQVYQSIRSELKKYSVKLVKKREIIALNKIDLIGKDQVEVALKDFKSRRKKVIAISSVTAEGCQDLIKQIQKVIS